MKLLLILLALTDLSPKEDKIRINKSYEIESPREFTVMIDNIFGDVEVLPSNDNNVYLELTIELSGSDEQIEKAKKELELGERFVDDSLILFTEAPFVRRVRWGYHHGFDIRRDPKYGFRYQYKLKVPKSSSVFARTVDDGDIVVKDIDGAVKACNVNGSVEIKNARDVRAASTVNGNVKINLLENPKQDVDFNTVNGDFTFELPGNFKAKIYFDSMNGDLYSAFNYKTLSPKVIKTESDGKFKIDTKSGVEIGTGGPEFSFKSINGNVYLKKTGEH